MQEGIQGGAHNPNKGLDTRKYLMAVFAFLLIACLAMLVWFHHTATTNSDPSVLPRTHAGDGVTATDKGGKR